MEDRLLPLRNLRADPDDEEWDDDYDSFVQLQRNDPKLKTLCIGSDEFWGVDFFDFPHQDDWGRLGECIGDHEHLVDLRLGAMEGVSEVQFDDFCLGVARNRSIKRLKLLHLNLFAGREFEMLTPFFVLNNLERLQLGEVSDIADTFLDREGVQHLSSALSRFSSLTEIFFPHIGEFGDDATGAMLVDALTGHAALRTLDLSGNDIKRGGFCGLASLVKSPTSHLQTLDLSCTSIDNERALILACGLRGNTSLKTLVFTGTCLAGQVWERIFAIILGPNGALEELLLYCCWFDDCSMLSLAHSLAENTTLKKLELDGTARAGRSGSIVSREGWRALFQVLRSHDHPQSVLEKLGLEHANFGDADAIELASALSVNSKLKTIDLSANYDITIAGWRAIAMALESPDTALEKLLLEYNATNDDEAVMAFASSFANNATVTELRIGMNPNGVIRFPPNITASGWAAFETALYNQTSIADTFLSNHTLHSIFYRGGRIPNETHRLLGMNRRHSKNQTARLKIIECHFLSDKFDQSIRSLADMDLEMIPHVVAWLGRDEELLDKDEKQVDGLPLLYPCVRAMPTILCGNTKGEKRKRCLVD